MRGLPKDGSPQISLTKLLREGQEANQAYHAAHEVEVRGNLRAGNSGIASEQGDVAGACHRRAHLRMLGIEVEHHSTDKLLMFELGIANEDIVYYKLMRSLPEGHSIFRESEIPTLWHTMNGTKVTGRPDLVIGIIQDTAVEGHRALEIEGAGVYFVPTLGIELKSVASVYTTAEVLFEGRPKVAHLIQAAHYMWQLDIPYRLCYKQYSNQVVPEWLGRKWPKEGQPGSEYLAYNNKGEIKYTVPYEIVYELQWSTSGFLEYRREDSDTPYTRTLVKAADIQRFFETASTMAEKGLGKRPMTIDAFGKEKSYSDCQYCPLQATCDKVDKVTKKSGKSPLTYQQWLQEVTEFSKAQKLSND